MKFGEKIKKLRSDNNMTQEDLAQKLFVTRTAVSKWETDKGLPGIDSLKSIADLFHISIDELISDDDIQTQRGKTLQNDVLCCDRLSRLDRCVYTVTVLFAKLLLFDRQYRWSFGVRCVCIAVQAARQTLVRTQSDTSLYCCAHSASCDNCCRSGNNDNSAERVTVKN